LDMKKGRLIEYLAVPPEKEEASEVNPASSDPDWGPLFRAAGLDEAVFKRGARPTLTPPVHGPQREAWTGVLPGRPDIPIRIEAAAYHGRPVFFQVVAPWTRRDESDAPT